jgi:hypothetical protein
MKDMEPVVALLRKEGLFEQPGASILIHVFSNGMMVNYWIVVFDPTLYS